MRAMTWYDHETESIWSQPLGRAMAGPLHGTELRLLPSVLTTWEQWKRDHPHTLAMTNDTDRLRAYRQEFSDDFVIGVLLEEEAKAYYYEDVLAVTGINDALGQFPILIWAERENFRAYLRQVGDRVLTFGFESGGVFDLETGTRWDLARGLALEGPLAGEVLQSVPSLTSYDWAWLDFYPSGEIYSRVE